MNTIIPKELLEEIEKFPQEIQENIINLHKKTLHGEQEKQMKKEADIKKIENKQKDKDRIAEIYKSLGVEPKKE